ncbi:DUF5063 domain-containing protein [Peribacillus sp. SCS-37]|uniref:DUF5063 domain-containing protein n=1 Tax=Paraperibacillus esterisolvens TaxID=3115296 RepID=UPI0039064A3F
MRIKGLDDFFQSAVHYCSIIEDCEPNQIHTKVKTLLVSLLDLYSKAIFLPEAEPGNYEGTDLNIVVPEINFGEYDHYWEIFNPYHLEEPVGASLSDDILDIYKDVKKGILLYEKNEHLEANWEWKFGFEIHWGSHAVDAIRALHSASLKQSLLS